MNLPEILHTERTEGGIKIWEQLVPDGWVEVDSFNPSGLNPWDVYGTKHQHELRNVMNAAGVPCLSLFTRHTNIGARGTGPGGSKRFGDDMMPGLYRTAVPIGFEAQFTAARAAHDAAVYVWLHEGGKMPEACRT